MFLKEIERKQKALQQQLRSVPDAVAFAREAQGGKTTGIKIPDGMRARLDAVQKRYGFTSIKQAVLFAVHLGLQQLEGTDL